MTAAALEQLVERCREMVAAHEHRNPDAVFLTERERQALTNLYLETCRTFDARLNTVSAA